MGGKKEAVSNRVRMVAFVLVAVILATTAVLLAVNALTAPYPWLNHDVSFLGYAGSQILAGDRLYVDFREVNPPGAFFLFTILLAFADLAGLTPFLVFQMFVMILAAAGLHLMWKTSAAGGEGIGSALVPLTYGLIAVQVNFTNNILPSNPRLPVDFGQREHLFVLLFVPYLLWRLSDGKPRLLQFAYLGALGYIASFKPYFVLLLAVVEFYILLRHRKLQFGQLTALAVGMILPYLLLAIHSTESFVAFFRDMVPLIFGGRYVHYGMNASEFLLSGYHLQMVGSGLVFIGLCLVCWLKRAVSIPTLALLVGISVLSYIGMLQQQKYWSYHGVVYYGVVLVLSACLLAHAAGRSGMRRTAKTCLGAVLVVILCFTVLSLYDLHVMLKTKPPKDFYVVPLIKDRQKVMFLSASVDYAYAPFFTRVRTVGPWQEHWDLPFLIQIADGRERKRQLEEYCGKVRQVILDEKPELLLFSPAKGSMPQGRHIHDILVKHGAVPFGMYIQIPRKVLFMISPYAKGWVVYQRVDETACGPGLDAG